jgi:hypothetical protein
MPRSTAAFLTVALFSIVACGFGGCGFAPAASGNSGSGASGPPLGSGASNGGGLVGGGAAQNGHGAVTGMNCREVMQPLAKLPPDILIIEDASGSMNNDITDTSCGNGGCGATSKWAQITPAINTVVGMTETTVNWGLKFFADTDATCGVGNGVAVPIGTGNAGAIATAIMGRTSANGGVTNGSRTPTRSAETAGSTYMRGLTDMNPRFIVLATDGLPNCQPGNTDTAADDSAGAVMSVMDSATAGIPTFVVGIATGGSNADTTLNNMATAGGYPASGATKYYSVASTAEFVSVLQTLVGVAATCTFTVPEPTGDTDRAHIAVVVNGAEIPKDTNHANGWDYTSTGMTAVQIYGPTCDGIMNGSITNVQIVFKCIVT